MKHLFQKRTIILIITFVIVLFSGSCDKLNDSVIPDVPVNLFIDLNIENELTVPGNAVFFPNFGFGGVIVYCELPGSYYAFDAACTNDISSSCSVVKDEELEQCPCLLSSPVVTCSCCDSQFSLLGNGSVLKGPAVSPLKPYSIAFMNSSLIRVYN